MGQKRYLPVMKNARKRLAVQIFGSLSVDVYGDEGDHFDREDRFSKVRSAIVHLAHQSHFDSDPDIGGKFNELRDKSEKLLGHPDVGTKYSPAQQKELRELLDTLMQAARETFNPDFSKKDLECFVAVCEIGRSHYEEAGHDPEEFIEERFVSLARAMSENFDAYEKTLNHKYVEE